MYSCKILCGDKFRFELEQADYLGKQKNCKNNGKEDDFSIMPYTDKRNGRGECSHYVGKMRT